MTDLLETQTQLSSEWGFIRRHKNSLVSGAIAGMAVSGLFVGVSALGHRVQVNADHKTIAEAKRCLSIEGRLPGRIVTNTSKLATTALLDCGIPTPYTLQLDSSIKSYAIELPSTKVLDAVITSQQQDIQENTFAKDTPVMVLDFVFGGVAAIVGAELAMGSDERRVIDSSGYQVSSL